MILSGGSINTPQMLMLSGIGRPDDLRAHGIDVVAELPGVGQNLSDHTSAALAFRRKTGGPFQKNMRLDRVGLSLVRAYLGKGGFAADLPFGITAFLKSPGERADAGRPAVVLDGGDDNRLALAAAVQETLCGFIFGARDADAPDKPRASVAGLRRSARCA